MLQASMLKTKTKQSANGCSTVSVVLSSYIVTSMYLVLSQGLGDGNEMMTESLGFRDRIID
jgi:hypothetical protein